MHLAPLIQDLAIILGVAGIVSILFQKIHQPVVLGYIIAGIIIGPHTPPFQLIKDVPNINTWAELGVIFLMFTLGLEFSFRKLARVGGSAVITSGMEIVFFIPTGFLIGKIYGWSFMDSLFLGAMLAISSTTIIIKALEELNLKKYHFAELIFAILIVEDLFAILLLVALGTIAVTKTISLVVLIFATFKLILVIGGWFITGYLLVPSVMRYVGRIGSDEMLTILALGFCLALVVFANYFHYSTALGAFIMGSILAETPVLTRIKRNMASLRDLFGAVFFVSIGMLIDPKMLLNHLGAIIVICVITIVGKILSTSLGSLVSGHSFRNSIRVGFGLAQIGEFSFIIAQLGNKLGVTSEFLYPIAVAVSLATTFTTPYLIRISGRAASFLESLLPKKIRDALNIYAVQLETKRAGVISKKTSLRPFLKWIINGLIVSVLFILSSDWVGPFISKQFRMDGQALSILSWCIANLISSPFVWAMLTAFANKKKENEISTYSPALQIFFQILTVLWMSTLSAEFFPGKYIAFVAAGTLILAIIFFYQHLESSYRWFEKQFLSTFEHQEGGNQGKEISFSHLAPWNSHMVKIEVHPNSKLVLKRVMDAALRIRYEVNIVAIQRGRRSIVTPLPEEIFLPGDELILLGTDEQLEKVKKEFEESIESINTAQDKQHYELRQMRLFKNSPLIGLTIRRSRIRDVFRAMVVGIDRGGIRKINPDSDMELLEGDILWIAGEKSKLDQLLAAFGSKSLS